MGEGATTAILLIGFAFAMFGARISRSVLTAPMIFLIIGVGFSQSGLFHGEEARELLHLVAEVSLILLLFLDAAQIDLASLRKHQNWPARMLLIGMPMAIILGTLATLVIFPEWPLVVSALVAALLAPTDAALGQAVVANKTVPERVRNAITVESGLNDGLALPIIFLFASLTVGMTQRSVGEWALFGAEQIGLGVLVGCAVGLSGAAILLFSKARMHTSKAYEGVGAIALAGLAYSLAQLAGGNGFISAFVAGLAFGNVVKGRCAFIYEFVENDGQLLVWASFFLIGAALLIDAVSMATPAIMGLVLVSLFVVRPLAIWIAMMGTKARPSTRLFLGWFGPRGLATALFALLVVEEVGEPWGGVVTVIAFNAVWMSALLHGLTAVPLARAYSAAIEPVDECAEKLAMPPAPGPSVHDGAQG